MATQGGREPGLAGLPQLAPPEPCCAHDAAPAHGDAATELRREEAWSMSNDQFTEPRWQRCPECGGTGWGDSRIRGIGGHRDPVTCLCRVCHGRGRAFGAWAHTHKGDHEFVLFVPTVGDAGSLSDRGGERPVAK